jgi:hypothetical protein
MAGLPQVPASVVIDMMPPTALALISNRRSGQITIVFHDKLSRLDLTILTDPGNYALVGPHLARLHPSNFTIVPNAVVRPNDPVTVLHRSSTPAKILRKSADRAAAHR